jgi:hypothetical protein
LGLESRDSFIAVDSAQLGAGLIVVSRESEGVIGDLPADIKPDPSIDPQTPARLVIEQVSAVEHASVAGVRSSVQMANPPCRVASAGP